jgi:hypothetical protein
MSRRRQSKQSNLRLLTAVAGVWAATLAAARMSGSRIGTAGRSVGRRARLVAAESSTRGAGAYRALRGDLPVQVRTQRRPVEYLALTVLAGATGAVTAVGIGRMMSRRSARMEELEREPLPEGVTRITEPVTGSVSPLPETSTPR